MISQPTFPGLLTADISRRQYVEAVVHAYRLLPDTLGHLRPADRRLAETLYERNVPLHLVTAAFLVAHARRTSRPPQAPPLGPIRSLAYFSAIVDELLQEPPAPAYLDYLRAKLRVASTRPA